MDYVKTLNRCVTTDELHTAWRRVAMELHPDVGGSTIAFQKAREVYMARKAEIELAAKKAEERAKALRYVGLAGSVLQDIAEGRDFTGNIKKMIPEEYALGVDIIGSLFNKKN